MLGSTLFLTIATLAGLLTGFAREWLLVADWGAGRLTDAFLVAMFLPEALRTMLAGGVLSAACLPLWQETPVSRQTGWLAGQVRHWLVVGCALALALVLLSPWLVRLVGPGLSAEDSRQASRTLAYLALVVPGLLLHAIFTVPSQARGHFLLPGLGSLLFNLPAVGYLRMAGHQADSVRVAQCMVAGSVFMLLALIPSAWHLGWRPWSSAAGTDARLVWRRLWPLLTSSGASQGLALLERVVASFLGEGSITMINLARKLVNLPLIALTSMNQVILGKMSGQEQEVRRSTLDQGLMICSLLTLPAAAGLIAAAPPLVTWLLPKGLSHGPLPSLLGLFAVSIIFGSWNALLARYYYAGGDTRTPLLCELSGSAVQAAGLLVLPGLLGIWGIAGAAMGGVLSTGFLLALRVDRALIRHWIHLGTQSVVICSFSIFLLYVGFRLSSWKQFLMASTYGIVLLAVKTVQLRRRAA